MKQILSVLVATVVLLLIAGQTEAQDLACTNHCISEYNQCQFILTPKDCMHFRL